MKIITNDEDGHQYWIPLDKRELFNFFLYDEDGSGCECWERDGWQQFEDCRVDGDFQEEKMLELQREIIELNKDVHTASNVIKDQAKEISRLTPLEFTCRFCGKNFELHEGVLPSCCFECNEPKKDNLTPEDILQTKINQSGETWVNFEIAINAMKIYAKQESL